MHVLIFGSRTITDFNVVDDAIHESGYYVTEVVEGGQRTMDEFNEAFIGGADFWAFVWAKNNDRPCKTMNADWKNHGKAAGPIRNSEMAAYLKSKKPDVGAVGIWDADSKSSGTKDMIKKLRSVAIEPYLKIYERNDTHGHVTREFDLILCCGVCGLVRPVGGWARECIYRTPRIILRNDAGASDEGEQPARAGRGDRLDTQEGIGFHYPKS